MGSLRQACSLNPDLKDIVERFCEGATREAQISLIDDLLLAWAGTSGMIDNLDDRVRGRYNLKVTVDPGLDRAEWERKIHILEAFNGRYFFALPDELEPGQTLMQDVSVNGSELYVRYRAARMKILDRAYQALFDFVYGQLAGQTRLAPIMDLIDADWDLKISKVKITFSRVEQYFRERMEADPVNCFSDLLDFTRVQPLEWATLDWNYNEFILELTQEVETTPELAAFFGEMKMVVAGSSGSDVNGSKADEVLFGNRSANTLNGRGGQDKLYGGGGNDVLDGGAGNDTLYGGAGDDTYLFRAKAGRDVINNAGGGRDRLRFEKLNPEDLWFAKTGPHLLIVLLGAKDQVTVLDWYTAGDHRIGTIEAGGLAVVEDQVDHLVRKLAEAGLPAGTDGRWTAAQRKVLAPVLAAYWQPVQPGI